MRRLVTILALLLLLSTAAPLLACMTEASMTRQESACCQAMHGKCDGMQNMGCCKTTSRTTEHPQLAATSPAIDLSTAALARPQPFALEVHILPPSVLAIADAHSPPGLVIARVTVLRI